MSVKPTRSNRKQINFKTPNLYFRQAYPHLTVGDRASSAPTLAIADHFQYKELSGAVVMLRVVNVTSCNLQHHRTWFC